MTGNSDYRYGETIKRVFGLKSNGSLRWGLTLEDLSVFKPLGLAIWAEESVRAKVHRFWNGPDAILLGDGVDIRFFSLYLSFEDLTRLAERDKFPVSAISFRTIRQGMRFETHLYNEVSSDRMSMAVWGEGISL